MRKKQNKGVRVWLPSDTARMLELARNKFGFTEGDESAVVLMALSVLLSGHQPSTVSKVITQDIDPVAIETQGEGVEDDALDIDFDDFDVT